MRGNAGPDIDGLTLPVIESKYAMVYPIRQVALGDTLEILVFELRILKFFITHGKRNRTFADTSGSYLKLG